MYCCNSESQVTKGLMLHFVDHSVVVTKHICISSFISIGTVVIELCEFNQKKKKKKKMDKMEIYFFDINWRKYLVYSLVSTCVVL